MRERRQGSVVDGVGEIIGGGGRGEVGPQHQVHQEVLAVALLVLEDPVVAANLQPLQLDPVGHQ